MTGFFKGVDHVARINAMRAYSIALSHLSIQMDEKTLARLDQLKDDDAVLRLRVEVSQRLAASRLRLVRLEQ